MMVSFGGGTLADTTGWNSREKNKECIGVNNCITYEEHSER